MTVDVYFLAGVLRACLILAGLAWAVYAWWNHVDYRRAVAVLLAFCATDLVAQQIAFYANLTHSDIPSDFSVYTLSILLGALLGLGLALLYARRAGLARAAVLDAGIIVLIAGGIGARVYYLLMHWDYYGEKSADLWNLAKGGMGLRGGLIVGLLVLAVFAVLRRESFWHLADAGALGLALAESLGWYGSGLIGANYGVVSEARWAPELPDLYGIIAPRVPVQMIAALFYFVLFCVLALWAWSSQPRAGSLFVAFLIISAGAMFVLGFVRADETAMWKGWRIDQWVDLVLVGLGFGILAMKSMKTFSLPSRRGQAEGRELA